MIQKACTYIVGWEVLPQIDTELPIWLDNGEFHLTEMPHPFDSERAVQVVGGNTMVLHDLLQHLSSKREAEGLRTEQLAQ